MTKKILLLDDMLDMLEGELELLEECDLDYQVEGIADADDLMPALEGENYDLVILDLHMPKKNGIDCLKEIKAEYPDLPVIIYSGFAHEVSTQDLIAAGASMVLTKPAPADHFLNAVKTRLDPSSDTSIVLEKGYQLLEVLTSELTRKIQELLTAGHLQLDEIAKELSLSEEFLRHLIAKYNLGQD